MTNKTTVRVRGLSLPVRIGVQDFERNGPQTVVFNIDMDVRLNSDTENGERDYVSYYPIVEHLTALSESGRHIDLVEELADEIFDFVFADPRVSEATVEVMKPEIIPQADYVGVMISRSNPAA